MFGALFRIPSVPPVNKLPRTPYVPKGDVWPPASQVVVRFASLCVATAARNTPEADHNSVIEPSAGRERLMREGNERRMKWIKI
jgi:hypothetical protein